MSHVLVALLFIMVTGDRAVAGHQLETSITLAGAEARTLTPRLTEVLSRTEQRIREVFGFKLDVKAVVQSSEENYDFLFRPDNPPQRGTLLVNTRIVKDYSPDELKIAAARAYYQAIWPRFRKPVTASSLLVMRLYEAGMTAYAAELLYPGFAKWKYAGLYGGGGEKEYQLYLSREKELAGDVLQTLSSGMSTNLAARLFPEQPSFGVLMSYRIMKTFERVMDPKMIQLMDAAEFQKRLPDALAVLIQTPGR